MIAVTLNPSFNNWMAKRDFLENKLTIISFQKVLVDQISGNNSNSGKEEFLRNFSVQQLYFPKTKRGKLKLSRGISTE